MDQSIAARPSSICITTVLITCAPVCLCHVCTSSLLHFSLSPIPGSSPSTLRDNWQCSVPVEPLRMFLPRMRIGTAIRVTTSQQHRVLVHLLFALDDMVRDHVDIRSSKSDKELTAVWIIPCAVPACWLIFYRQSRSASSSKYPLSSPSTEIRMLSKTHCRRKTSRRCRESDHVKRRRAHL